ncbi:MAG: alpha/beta hydrolase-fold protein [Ktedonobacterales bacterium]
MKSVLITSIGARRKLIVLLASLLGMAMLFASCGTLPIKPVTRLEATPVHPHGHNEHAAIAEKKAAATATPALLPNVVGSISCPALSTASTTGFDGFLTCEYEGGYDHQMTFYLYVPNGYNPSKTYPMVLILHGVDEAYDPTQSPAANQANILEQDYVAVWGPGYPAGGPSVQTKFPCFVIVPQLVGANRWVDAPGGATSYQLTPQPTLSLQMAIDSTMLMEKEYSSIDTQRLYITGISMGAYGVWDSILRWPSLFAAAVPVSGGGDPALAKRIVDLPIWDFHGADDNLVPVAGSQLMIQALQAAGSQPCYTQYPGQLHVIWDLVYDLDSNPNNPLYPWLFAQVKNDQTIAYSCR